MPLARDTSTGRFAAGPDAPPPERGEATGRQGAAALGPVTGASVHGGGGGGTIYGLMFNPYSGACSSSPANPCGFPGWGSLYLGTYSTYRWMLCHHKIQQVRSRVLNEIMAIPKWDLRIRDGTKAKWVDFVKETVLPLRHRAVTDAFQALDFGSSGFEKIWNVERGRYLLYALKPLLPDMTRVLTDDRGDFVGLTQGGLSGRDVGTGRDGLAVNGLPLNKCWLYTYRKVADNWYGWSRLENARHTAWAGWLDAMQQLQRLAWKVSGIQPLFKVPAGGFTDVSTNKFVSFVENAVNAARTLIDGQGCVLVNMALEAKDSDPEMRAKLAEASMTSVDVLNFGSLTPAIEGLLARLRYHEEGMVEGYQHSPRELGESRHGSRADAEQHTDTGTLDPQLVAADIDRSFNERVMDDVLTLNFGRDAKGAVAVFTPPMRDTKVTDSRKFIFTLSAANKQVAARVADMLGDDGWHGLMSDAGLSPQKAWSETEDAAPPDFGNPFDQQQQPGQPPQNNPPPLPKGPTAKQKT